MEKKLLIKDMIKRIFMQTCMICFGIVAINSIIIAVTHNYGGEARIDYLFPLGLVICSILCGASVAIFYIQKLPFIAKCIIHFLVIIGIVTGIGIWFGWITGPIECLIVYGIVLIVYVGIWLITYRDSVKNAEKINKALENNRDLD